MIYIFVYQIETSAMVKSIISISIVLLRYAKGFIAMNMQMT